MTAWYEMEGEPSPQWQLDPLPTSDDHRAFIGRYGAPEFEEPHWWAVDIQWFPPDGGDGQFIATRTFPSESEARAWAEGWKP